MREDEIYTDNGFCQLPSNNVLTVKVLTRRIHLGDNRGMARARLQYLETHIREDNGSGCEMNSFPVFKKGNFVREAKKESKIFKNFILRSFDRYQIGIKFSIFLAKELKLISRSMTLRG